MKIADEAVQHTVNAVKRFQVKNKNTPHIDTRCIIIIEALEKQIPKTPDYEADGYDDSGKLVYDTAYCLNCRHMYEVDYEQPKYCCECGQALDWGTSQEEVSE